MRNHHFKRPAVTLLIVTLLPACQAERASPPEPDLTAFATGYAAAWSGGDPAPLASFYAGDGTLKVNDGEPSVGREAITETARGYMTAFPDMVVRLVELRETGDTVEFHWHWTGTHTGPGGTGSAVDLRGYEVWTLDENGLILVSLGRFDADEYQRQLEAGVP